MDNKADVIYLYPKTSCVTGDCQREYKRPQTSNRIKSSLSTDTCETPDYFTCYDRAIFRESREPQEKNGIRELNPQCYTSKLAEGFNRVKCNTNCPSDTYISADPRQYSSTLAEYLPIDRPPMNGDVRLKDIYSSRWDNYGSGFMQYENIRDGQITYYVDNSIKDAFYTPVYGEMAKETAVLYKDPMGSMKPEYNRTPIINTENPATTTPEAYPYCLSYIQDTQSFREDLIALQQRRHNQEKWSARWA